VPYFVFLHGELDPWFKSVHPLRHLRRWLDWAWTGYPLLRDAHAVFFTGEEERRRARESFWLYDCHEFVLRYGVAGVPSGVGEGSARSSSPPIRRSAASASLPASGICMPAMGWTCSSARCGR
jgi:hypothetical protein